MELRKFDQEEKARQLRIEFRKKNFQVTAEESDEFDKWPFDESVKMVITFDGTKKFAMHMSYEEATKVAETLTDYLESKK